MPAHAPSPSLVAIRKAVGSHPPTRPDEPSAAAAVALVLAGPPADLSICVIQRAERAGDPWSGHMALPGGRFAPEDAHLRMTAERETREEVAIELPPHSYLGHLLDHSVTHLDGRVGLWLSAFAFHLDTITALRASREVAHAFWIPLKELWRPSSQTSVEVRHGDDRRSHSAIRVHERHIWGLTRRILAHLGSRTGTPLPEPEAAHAPTVVVTLAATARRDFDAWSKRS